MIKKITLLFVVLALALSACTIDGNTITFTTDQIGGSGNIITEDREVSDFTKVDLKSIGNLTIIEGTEEALSITADDNLLQYITTDVVNGTLEISMKPNLSLDPTRTIEYQLTVKELTDITLSGFGDINADTLDGEDIEVVLTGSGNITLANVKSENGLFKVSGFGDINIGSMVVDQPTFEITGSGDVEVDDLQAFTLDVKISGFGDANLTGKADVQEVQILGSGNYYGQNLEGNEAEVKITGFGDATLWVKDTLDITITGSGNVEYYGSPQVTQTMTGFGKVESLGEH